LHVVFVVALLSSANAVVLSLQGVHFSVNSGEDRFIVLLVATSGEVLKLFDDLVEAFSGRINLGDEVE
jgi:hypothetical protein